MSKPKNTIEQTVALCNCGHKTGAHAGEAHDGYCLEYLYDGLAKCTCQAFSPFLTLDREEDILELTSELSIPDVEE